MSTTYIRANDLTLEEFSLLLRKYNVPTERYGQGVAKTLDEFHRVILEDECKLIDCAGRLERHRDVVRIFLRALVNDSEYELVLQRSVLANGFILTRQQPLGMTMLGSVTWKEALYQCLKERFNFELKDIDALFSIEEETYMHTQEKRESDTFPGLPAVFSIHQCVVRLKEIRNRKCLAMGMPNAIDFCLPGKEESTHYYSWKNVNALAAPAAPANRADGIAEGLTDARIVVCVRVRPFIQEEIQGRRSGGKIDLCVSMPGRTKVVVARKDETAFSNETQTFTFDRCYWSYSPDHPDWATQETLHQELGEKMISNAMDGYNNCIFAYGQTGSGKSYSVTGGQGRDRGLLPRIVESLFQHLEDLPQGTQWGANVSCLEIYNESLVDLLAAYEPKPDWTGSAEKIKSSQSNPVADSDTKLKLRCNPKNGTAVIGLSSRTVSSPPETLKIFEEAIRRRSTAATIMNASSSRSHCVFQFMISVMKQDGLRLCSTTYLVDLAGSERSSKNRGQKESKEGCMINQSLTVLARVISELTKGSDRVNPPFRESKLTMVLKDALCGNCKTAMIGAISPSSVDYLETCSTLKFCEKVKKVQTFAVVNQFNQLSMEAQFRKEIEDLQKQVMEVDDLRAQIAQLQTSVGLIGNAGRAATESAEQSQEFSVGMVSSTTPAARKGTPDEVLRRHVELLRFESDRSRLLLGGVAGSRVTQNQAHREKVDAVSHRFKAISILAQEAEDNMNARARAGDPKLRFRTVVLTDLDSAQSEVMVRIVDDGVIPPHLMVDHASHHKPTIGHAGELLFESEFLERVRLSIAGGTVTPESRLNAGNTTSQSLDTAALSPRQQSTRVNSSNKLTFKFRHIK